MTAESAYLFRHALLRDAAYQLQLPADRARLHGFALVALEDACGGRPADAPADAAGLRPFVPHPTDAFAAELAGHAGNAAGEPAVVSAVRRLYLRRGAEHAERHFRNSEAEALWGGLAEAWEPDRAEALARGAHVALNAGRPAAAEDLFGRAVTAARQSGDGRAEGRALAGRAIAQGQRGLVSEAVRDLARARELLSAAGDAREAALTRVHLAAFYRETGRVPEAEGEWSAALPELRAAADRRSEGVLLSNLAALYADTGRLDLAERTHAEAIGIHRETGNRRLEGSAIGHLANVFMDLDRTAEAGRLYEQALAIHREVGNRRQEAVDLGNTAGYLKAIGRLDDGERLYRDAIALHREVGNRRSEGIALGNLAGLVLARGRVEESGRLFGDALAIHRELGNRRFEGHHLLDGSMTQLRLGRRDTAVSWWRSGCELLRRLHDLPGIERKRREMEEACRRDGVPPLREDQE